MPPLEITGLTVFILVFFVGILLSAMGLPGTILIAVNAAVYAFVSGFAKIGFASVLILAAMAVAAELFDIGMTRAGAVRFSISMREAGVALLGGLAGAVILVPLFFGPGMLMGIFLGAGTAVFTVEMYKRHKLKAAFRAGAGALLGRMAGIAVKGMVSVTMAAIALLNVYT